MIRISNQSVVINRPSTSVKILDTNDTLPHIVATYENQSFASVSSINGYVSSGDFLLNAGNQPFYCSVYGGGFTEIALPLTSTDDTKLLVWVKVTSCPAGSVMTQFLNTYTFVPGTLVLELYKSNNAYAYIDNLDKGYEGMAAVSVVERAGSSAIQITRSLGCVKGGSQTFLPGFLSSSGVMGHDVTSAAGEGSPNVDIYGTTISRYTPRGVNILNTGFSIAIKAMLVKVDI